MRNRNLLWVSLLSSFVAGCDGSAAESSGEDAAVEEGSDTGAVVDSARADTTIVDSGPEGDTLVADSGAPDTAKADTASADTAVDTAPAGSISIAPGTDEILVGKSTWFEATVTGLTDPTVSWSVEEAGGGTIGPSGVYHAPDIAGTYHVVATSKASPTKTAKATVVVRAPNVEVFVGPSAIAVAPGQKVCFETAIPDSNDQRVTWSTTSTGTFTGNCFWAPTATGTYPVVATSIAAPTKSATASVKVVSGGTSVNPWYTPPLWAISPGQAIEIRVDAASSMKVEEAGGGVVKTFSASVFGGYGFGGRYWAPSTRGVYHVTITRSDDPRMTTTIPILVGQATNFRVSKAKLAVGRVGMRLTKMKDGRVLMSGGYAVECGIASCPSAHLAVFDPAQGTIEEKMLTTERVNHVAVALDDGRVLIAGGWNGTSDKLSSAEVFDPKTATSTAIAGMSVKRDSLYATKLPDGKVLLGGSGSVAAELFDPATNTFSVLDDSAPREFGARALLMENGKVLIAGGVVDGATSPRVTIFDPVAKTFTAKGSCASLQSLTLVSLGSSKVFMGGNGGTLNPYARIYDDALGNCTTSQYSLSREGVDAARLPDGRIALIGGVPAATSAPTAAAVDFLDLATGTLFPHLATLQVPRTFVSSTVGAVYDGIVVLDDGRIMAAGGYSSYVDPTTSTFVGALVDSIELWVP